MTQAQKEDTHSKDQARAQLSSITEIMKNYAEAIDDDNQNMLEALETEIHEGPLSIQVRSGWASTPEDFEAEEYEILLCTGGPAVRIIGEFDEYKQPDGSVVIQHQDWGTPWTTLHTSVEEDTALLEYAQKFYFGG